MSRRTNGTLIYDSTGIIKSRHTVFSFCKNDLIFVLKTFNPRQLEFSKLCLSSVGFVLSSLPIGMVFLTPMTTTRNRKPRPKFEQQIVAGNMLCYVHAVTCMPLNFRADGHWGKRHKSNAF